MFPSPGLSARPVYWQRRPSRSQMARALNVGRLARHLPVAREHDHRRHADQAAHGAHEAVVRPHGQPQPFGPGAHGVHGLPIDVQAAGGPGHQLAERIDRRARGDGLPVGG